VIRIVLDTNVLVSGILSPHGPPGWIVEAVLAGELETAFNAPIRSEYEDVLVRRELSLDPPRVSALLDILDAYGLEVVAPPWPEKLPDSSDASFLAVADRVGCPLVTGNVHHFPARARRGVAVLTPRQFVDSVAARREPK
jgi:predicted nucleic acid-binding protein